MGVLLIALIAITIMLRNGGGTVIWVILCGLLLLPAVLATGTGARTRRLAARISQEQRQQGHQQQSLGGPQHTTQPFSQPPPMVVQPYQTLGYQPGSEIDLDDAVSRMRPGSDISLDDLALPGSSRRSGSARPAPSRPCPARPAAPAPSSAIRSGSSGSSAIGTSLASASVLGSSLTASSLLGSGSCLLQNALEPTTVTHSAGAGHDPRR